MSNNEQKDMSKNPIPLNIKQVLKGQNDEDNQNKKQDNYIIPIYQRNYDWGREEITQLIQDIWDSWQDNKDKNYYIGTLVTHEILKGEHKGKYEVLDGQQRLTTLYILVGALKSILKDETTFEDISKLNLHFEAREESTRTLKNILAGQEEGEQEQPSIIDGFESAKNHLEQEIKKENLQTFVKYLLKNVILVRTKVPEDTDLNHYFEIMNNRGEQLEKHEILKARLLECIKDGSSSKYAKVWEACSQMNSYVQMNFDKSDRDKLFGTDWNALDIEKIGGIQGGENGKTKGNTITDIIENFDEKSEEENGGNHSEEDEKFESIIDFPNFLLQVLKATSEKYTRKETHKNEEVLLDDKKLLEEFDKFEESESFAMTFIDNLLKYRFWFDKYIIKRNFANEKNNWDLQKLEENQSYSSYVNSFGDENIIMIQTMFHVSNSSKSNKRWLQKVFVGNKEKIADGKIDYGTFLINLEQISRDLFDEPLGPRRYHFNLLDYVIWKSDKIDNDTKKAFSFKFRNSIEHFHPQSKVADLKKGNDEQEFSNEDKQKVLHSFGNLAWTTKSKNSSLSNSMPHEKAGKIDESHSLKLQLMANEAKKGENNWNAETIEQHRTEMQKLLDDYLQKEQS